MSGRGAVRNRRTRTRHRVPALIVGLDCITGLQTARLLSARGIPVYGIAADPGHFACHSRSVTEVIAGEVSGPQLLTTLDRMASRWDEPPVLLPCTDAGVETLAMAGEVAGYRTALPPAATVRRLLSKDGFARHAAAHGLPVPTTIVVRDADDVARAAELRYPCVVKPSVKTGAWEQAAGGKVVVVDSPADWLALHARVTASTPTMIVQEWVPGGDDQLISCNWYVARDGTTVTFVARKLRQWPVQRGTSSLGESVHDPEMLELTTSLLASVDYRGLGYLEIKRDPRSGRSVIIEPNVGRPTGRSALAEACGVELLASMYADALGLALPPVRSQRNGVKWVYLRHDLQSAAAAIRSGDLTFRGWWASLQGPRVYAVLAWRDPIPFLLDWRRSARRLTTRTCADTPALEVAA